MNGNKGIGKEEEAKNLGTTPRESTDGKKKQA